MKRLVIEHRSGPDRVLVTPQRLKTSSFMLTRDERVKACCSEVELRVGDTVLRVTVEDDDRLAGFAA